MTDSKKHIDKKAAICTAISIITLVILLLFFGFNSTLPEEEEGMLINFGNTETGSGDIEPAKASPPAKVTPPPPKPKAAPTPEPTTAAAEDLNTQDFEEAAALEAAKKKAKKDQEIKKQKELDRQREIDKQKEIQRQKDIEEQRKIEEQKEIERLKEIEIERQRLEEAKRIEDERKAKEAKAEAIRQQTSNAFGKANTTSTGEGATSGEGNQGDPNGSVDTKNRDGNGLGTSGNWSLAGRSLVGALPKPIYNIQEPGIVVVEIAVDKTGRVTSATPILRGSTTQDAQLWKLAQEAALRAQFNENPGAQAKQVGTITYHFVLN